MILSRFRTFTSSFPAPQGYVESDSGTRVFRHCGPDVVGFAGLCYSAGVECVLAEPENTFDLFQDAFAAIKAAFARESPDAPGASDMLESSRLLQVIEMRAYRERADDGDSGVSLPAAARMEAGLRTTLLMCLFAEHGSRLTIDLVGDRGRLIACCGDRTLVHYSRRQCRSALGVQGGRGRSLAYRFSGRARGLRAIHSARR